MERWKSRCTMQVVVKKPRIRLEGEIGGSLVQFLRDQYGEVEIIEDEGDELVEVTKSDWYQSIRETITPGENMRVYREMHGLTQDQLAEKLGNLTRQNISNMENGHRSISKTMAKKLAALFDVTIEKFV
ncbi:MAG: XRE family transcriptional regulator [Spirochaetaceae bacterium]|nr:MAG: XRE family transcriptional regulator [Spirochaetaceae bacterium]